MCAKEGEGGNERNDITLTRGACTGIMWAALCCALLANCQHSLGTMWQSWRWGEEWQGKVRGGGRVMFVDQLGLGRQGTALVLVYWGVVPLHAETS